MACDSGKVVVGALESLLCSLRLFLYAHTLIDALMGLGLTLNKLKALFGIFCSVKTNFLVIPNVFPMASSPSFSELFAGHQGI